MPDERWAPIPRLSGYEASDRGRVRSVDRVLANGVTAGGKLLKPKKDKDGYRRVKAGGEWEHVARLVLEAHAGPPPTPGHEALHGDGRRWRNWLRNLRWGTRAENRADRDRHEAIREERRAVSAETAPCPSPGGSEKEGMPS